MRSPSKFVGPIRGVISIIHYSEEFCKIYLKILQIVLTNNSMLQRDELFTFYENAPENRKHGVSR